MKGKIKGERQGKGGGVSDVAQQTRDAIYIFLCVERLTVLFSCVFNFYCMTLYDNFNLVVFVSVYCETDSFI